jgi:hypothetical protein
MACPFCRARVNNWAQVVNADDVDPITLEPVRKVCAPWLWRLRPQDPPRVYDGWAWLEMLCRDSAATHPLTKQPLTIASRWAIYSACLDCDACAENACTRDGPLRQRLLDQCASLRIAFETTFSASGKPSGVLCAALSPLLAINTRTTHWTSDGARHMTVGLLNGVGMELRRWFVQVSETGKIIADETAPPKTGARL